MDNTPFMAKELPMAIQTNEPISKPSSNHIAPFFVTLLFFLCIGAAIPLYILMMIPDYALGLMIGGGYLIYLIGGVCCNKSAQYLNNSKSFEQYQDVYYKMRDSKGYFFFHVECYHYETIVHHHTSTDANGNTTHSTSTEQRKVVTHSATQNLFPSACVDIGGHIEDLYNTNQLIFFKYIPKFQFDSLNSQIYFQKFYQEFKRRNDRDVYQNAGYNFVIPGFIERINFFTNKQSSGSGFFYLWGFFGFVYFYLLYLQRKVSRFQISIVKRITF